MYDANLRLSKNELGIHLETDKNNINKYDKLSNSEQKILRNVELIEKGNGYFQRIDKGLDGTITKNYILHDKKYMSRSLKPDGIIEVLRFDDNGKPYIKSQLKKINGNYVKYTKELVPNSIVQRDNVTTHIDEIGRPLTAKVTNLEIKETGSNRLHLSSVERGREYKLYFERGHLIPDRFFGKASMENIVPQYRYVNRSEIKKVENLAAEIKNSGKKVDYEVKVNYVGKSKVPSSFETRVYADGNLYHSAKLYNQKPLKIKYFEQFKKAYIDAAERTSLQNLKAVQYTATLSALEQIDGVVQGKVNIDEAIVNFSKDTVTASAIELGTNFISKEVTSKMSNSAIKLIQQSAKMNIPAVFISYGIASYDDIMNYANGTIENSEFVYNMGENGAQIVGAIAGSALSGAALGSIVPGAGNVAGFAVGALGGMVGCAVSSGAYKTAVELGGQGAEILADKSKEFAQNTIDLVSKNMPEKVNDIKSAFNEFATKNNLPFSV